MPVFGVREVRIATPRTRLLTIDFGDHPFTFMAGQAVLVGLQNSTNRRPYSIASSPQQALRARAFELLVQVEDSAAPEPHLELATAGSQLVVDGPFGSFNLPAHISEQHVLFIAGGTGIAPLRSMLWDVIERRAVDDLTLIYSARTASELAYHEELSALARDGLLHLQLTTTRDATSWSGRRGRVDETLVRSMLRTAETRCLVCGPPPLVADATALLRQAGVSAERILTESYAG
jgi:NAD(P)H-flavin reductase